MLIFVNKRLDMSGVFTLSLKITNWCNLNCLHCAENSGCHEPLNFMDLKKFEQYIYEFKKLPFKISEHVLISGGEGLAPYLFGQPDYIPTALRYIQSANFVPTIKTNGVWGKRYDIRMQILKDLAKCAYDSGNLVTLDISVDEFHNNITSVANVIASALSSDDIMYGVRICLVGFYTFKSINALSKLWQELIYRDLYIDFLSDGNWGVYNSRGTGFQVIVDYHNAVFDLGRAKQNNVYTVSGFPKLQNENCLIIDNNDIVTLNHVYSEKIAGRKTQNVIETLVRQYGE